MLTNLTQYATHKCAQQRYWRPTHLSRYGPAYLVALSVPLVMADLTRHVLQDAGFWKAGPSALSSAMYKSDWSSTCDSSAAVDVCTAPVAQGGYGHSGTWHCDLHDKMCECGDHMHCLTAVGVWFTVVFTYLGFACLLGGVLWGVDLPAKLQAQWRIATRQSR